MNRGVAVPVVAVISESETKANRRRYIDQQAGRALEILGHAIEYLADEFVHEGASPCARDPRVEAIQLLMARNREIYFDCPVIPTLQDRFRAFVRAIFFGTRQRRDQSAVYDAMLRSKKSSNGAPAPKTLP